MLSENKTPKIIHFFHDSDIDVWKKTKTPQFRMCYMSWKRFCPDYKIMHWHDGLPEFQEMLKKSKFVRECYKRKMWAYISDYVRVYALYNYGGVYVDTDLELIKNIDEFLKQDFFISVEGNIFKGKNVVEPAFVGGKRGHYIFKEIMEIYESDEIFNYDEFMAPFVYSKVLEDNAGFSKIDYIEHMDSIDELYDKNKDNNSLKTLEQYKIQKITFFDDKQIAIYPCEYFCPCWNVFAEESITDNTHAIHWNQSSWWGTKKDSKNHRALKNIKYTGFHRVIAELWPFIYKIMSIFIPVKSVRTKIKNIY